MRRHVLVGAGVCAAAAGAVLWAYGLAELQPSTEPSGSAENNSYWVRDARWFAALGVLGIVVALSRGDRHVLRYLYAGAGLWLACDVLLDRAGVALFAVVAPAAMLLAGAAAVAAARLGRRADRGVLTTFAAICAASVPVAVVVSSPFGGEAEVAGFRAAAAVVLCIAAVSCAVSAAPIRRWSRLVAAGGVGAVAVTGVCAVSITAPVSAAGVPSGRLWASPLALLGAGLLTAVWALSRPWPGVGLMAGVAATSALGYMFIAATALTVAAFVPLGAPLTALAGNAAVIPADTDMLYLLSGIMTGTAFVVTAAAARRLEPAPTPR